MSDIEALYYPFSRCINPARFKQMLLVFDKITFLDAVEDEDWRQKLMSDLRVFDHQFTNYKEISEELSWLKDQSTIKIVDPSTFTAQSNNLYQQQL